MAAPRGVRAILFDLDGTLADTAPDITAAVDATLRALGRAPVEPARVRSYIGRGVDVLLHRVLTGDRDGVADNALHLRARDVFHIEYEASNGRTAACYAGVREGLDEARRLGLRLGCVTNKPQLYSEVLLDKLGLGAYFDIVVGGDALAARKPDPEPLLHAARALGVEPGECLMIGDSSNDAIAARAAGMPVVLMSYGYSEDEPVDTIDCDRIAASIADIVGDLGRPFARND